MIYMSNTYEKHLYRKGENTQQSVIRFVIVKAQILLLILVLIIMFITITYCPLSQEISVCGPTSDK